ncbi:MAG: hypothetical protein GF310_12800 [candidate division Zixibacteria bacterium]|nr:hypothetical protein [candidate division Zixibacteria bacterium]
MQNKLKMLIVFFLFAFSLSLISCSDTEKTDQVVDRFNQLVEQADQIAGYGKYQVAGSRDSLNAFFMILNTKTGDFAVWKSGDAKIGSFEDLIAAQRKGDTEGN